MSWGVVQALAEKGHPLPALFPRIIIQQAPMPVVRWLLAREPALTQEHLRYAAASGRIPVLRMALARGMTLGPEVYACAIANRSPEVIYYYNIGHTHAQIHTCLAKIRKPKGDILRELQNGVYSSQTHFVHGYHAYERKHTCSCMLHACARFRYVS